MGFTSPLMLLWLLVVPVIAGLIWLAMRRRNTSAARFAAADMMDGLIPSAGWKIWVPPVLIVIAVAVGAIAALIASRLAKCATFFQNNTYKKK